MSGIFCNSSFAKWLIDNNKLNPDVYKEMKIILIYSNSLKEIKHAGIVKDSTQDNFLIISKFGVGQVYQHPENEVPDNYGSTINDYEKPQLKDIENYFKEYLQFLPSFISEAIK